MIETQVQDEYSHFFEVKLDVFSGPIDLLLHLVKRNELPIEKVSLAKVASQYLQCIELIKHFDLDIAGEYLVIAATLVSIKASVLLNEPVALVEDEEGHLVDPHEELLNKLREAAIYQEGARALASRKLLGYEVFASPGTLSGVDAPPVRYRPHDAMLLGMAFRKVLDRLEKEQKLTISLEQVSVVQRMMELLDALKSAGGKLSFEMLVADVMSRVALVASFVALLELCRRQVIQVQQEGLYGEITIGLAAEGEAADLNLSSEFDRELDGPVEAIVNA